MLVQEMVLYIIKGLPCQHSKWLALKIASKGDRDGTQIPQLRVAFFFFLKRNKNPQRIFPLGSKKINKTTNIFISILPFKLICGKLKRGTHGGWHFNWILTGVLTRIP